MAAQNDYKDEKKTLCEVCGGAPKLSQQSTTRDGTYTPGP